MNLDEFRRAYAADDNEWWRLESGEMQVLFDQATDRLDAAEVEAARAKGEADNLRERLSTYERAVKNQASRVDRLSLDLAEARTARDEMRNDLREMEQAMSAANEVLTEAHQRRAAAEQAAHDLSMQLALRDQEVGELRDEVLRLRTDLGL